LKHCSKCDKTKPLDEFSLRRRAKDGRQPWCSQCVIAYSAEYNKLHKEYTAQRAQRQNDRRASVTHWLNEIKADNGCVIEDCTEKDPVALDYHHLSNKSF